jgi:multiple sugar transport system ATP-binding protein
VSRVVLDNISKTFPDRGRAAVRALRQVSLTANPGELTVLLGPSGSGKTTLLRVIAGLEQPDSGGLVLDGRDLLPLAPRDRDVAMVFQEPALYPHLTVRGNLAFGLRLRKLPAAEIRQRVGETADWLGIGNCLDRLPQELSGGQRQRVALGRAIVRRPRVHLLDEPLSQLDTPLRLQLRQDLRRIQRELGATMILVTHDQADAFAIADRVAVMMDGSILQCDQPLTVYRAPACLALAAFVGNLPMNLLPVKVSSVAGAPALDWFGNDAASPAGEVARLTLPPDRLSGGLAAHVNRRIILGIRPELLHSGLDQTSGALRIRAMVLRTEFSGADLLVFLNFGKASLVARADAGASAVPGEDGRFSVCLSDCLFYDPETAERISSHS